jgi:hypothetical protein
VTLVTSMPPGGRGFAGALSLAVGFLPRGCRREDSAGVHWYLLCSGGSGLVIAHHGSGWVPTH